MAVDARRGVRKRSEASGKRQEESETLARGLHGARACQPPIAVLDVRIDDGLEAGCRHDSLCLRRKRR